MSFSLRSFFLLLFLCAASAAWAGGSIKTDINGLPLHWQGSVVFNPESGALKPGVYDHEASVALVEDAFSTWLNIPGVELKMQRGAVLSDGGDVTAENASHFLESSPDSCYDNDPSTPCVSPVVFDESGEIMDQIFGDCSRFSILGFAGFQDNTDERGAPADAILQRGQALFSGACIPPMVTVDGCNPCTRQLNETEIRTIMIHEIGHLLGMDHSQVNPKVFESCRGACPENVAEGLPTMFPILVEGAHMETLHEDDKAYFLRLYGSASAQASTCSVSGKVLARDGQVEVRGVEVVARNVDPDAELYDAFSFVSGAQAPRDALQGSCKGDCGKYTITGLYPGETYKLCVQKIKQEFTGGSSVEPLDPPLQGFTDQCFSDKTLSCVCDAGGCSEFVNQDLVTDRDGVSGSSNLTEPDAASSGGCSLAKPVVETGIWKFLGSELTQAKRWPLTVPGGSKDPCYIELSLVFSIH